MATPTYDLLDSTTLSSAASSVTFSSIDQSYRDLIVVTSNNTTAASYRFRLNGDTGSNYSVVAMGGDGSTTYSFSQTSTSGRAGGSNSSSALNILQIMDYSATDKHKSTLLRNQGGSVFGTGAEAGRWANTAAVTTFEIYQSSGSFASGTTFYLYGIAS